MDTAAPLPAEMCQLRVGRAVLQPGGHRGSLRSPLRLAEDSREWLGLPALGGVLPVPHQGLGPPVVPLGEPPALLGLGPGEQPRRDGLLPPAAAGSSSGRPSRSVPWRSSSCRLILFSSFCCRLSSLCFLVRYFAPGRGGVAPSMRCSVQSGNRERRIVF